MHLSNGDRLGRYEILEPLGAGGMGEVYRARDHELDRDVAVKVLPEAVARDPDRLARFKREAKAVARLSHPSILEIYDFGRQDDVSYTVTELLEGEDLSDHLQSVGGPMPWKEVRRVGAAVADGLAAAQGNGVVQRDLKPSNIMICSDGRVKILDFGLARFHEPATPEAETASATPALSTPGTVMGTVGYMSPEQVRGEAADARSDIFSLGCVLYEMLSGHRTFKRDTSAETMTAILREEPESFTEAGVEVAPEVAEIVERCLEKNPDRRFQSAADLAFALRGAAIDTGPPVTRPHPASGGHRGRWMLPSSASLPSRSMLAPGKAFKPAVKMLLERGDIEVTDLNEANNRCKAVVGDRTLTFRVIESGEGRSRMSILIGGGDGTEANQQLADALMQQICGRLEVACEHAR